MITNLLNLQHKLNIIMTNKACSFAIQNDAFVQKETIPIQLQLSESIATSIFLTLEENLIEKKLVDKEIDAALVSMSSLPLSINPDLAIAAVVKRSDPREMLIINPSSFDSTADCRLKQNANVGVFSSIIAEQLSYLRKDINIILKNEEDVETIEGFDAVLCSNTKIQDLLPMPSYEIVNFHVSEIVPSTSQGIIAIICRKEDIELRKILLQFHDEETTACSNVERKILKQMEDRRMLLNVHCTKDLNGNYQVHAACKPGKKAALIKLRKSQSTIFGLAESVAQELKTLKN